MVPLSRLRSLHFLNHRRPIAHAGLATLILMACHEPAVAFEVTAAQLDPAWPYECRTALPHEVGPIPETLSTVRWEGQYFDGTLPGDLANFLLRIYADQAGLPGETWYEAQLSVVPRSVDPENGTLLYAGTVVPPLTLPASSSVWVEVQALHSGLPQWGLADILTPRCGPNRAVRSRLLGFSDWTPRASLPLSPTSARPSQQLIPSQDTPQVLPQARIIHNYLGREFTVSWSAPSGSASELAVVAFDAAGRTVGVLHSQPVGASVESSLKLQFPPGTPSGCYFVQVRLDAQTLTTRRLVLVK